MKIKDYIRQKILDYPGIYRYSTYEESRLRVLDHIFFSPGNGLGFTKDGYITSREKTIAGRNGKLISIAKPYGEETVRPFPEGYFNMDMYKLGEIIGCHETKNGTVVYCQKDIKPYLLKYENTTPFSPYSITRYSMISKWAEGQFLQNDWIDEAYYLCRKVLEYYNNLETYKHSIYYPVNLDRDPTIMFAELSTNNIREIRKQCGYRDSDLPISKSEIREKKIMRWLSYKTDQIEKLKEIIYKMENMSDDRISEASLLKANEILESN